MTAVVEQLFDQHKLKVIVFSNYSEFFENNPKVCKNYNFKRIPKIFRNILLSFLRFFEGEHIANFCFSSDTKHTLEQYMRESKARISLIEAHSLHFHKKLNLKHATPKIYFKESELKKFHSKYKELPTTFGIIQPAGKTTYTPNKEWGFNNFQTLVHRITNTSWVQTGLPEDLLLDTVIDLRGKTESLRELAWVISKACFIVSSEGLLNHLAASVGTTSFCIFSGFHPSEIATYSTTTPLMLDPQPTCSPCWLLETCPQEKKYCTEGIVPEHVISVINNYQPLS
jgi:ADP-heptose:LPS heptosyltransferase